MDVRAEVGGALTRNAVLCELLWNYADLLERGSVEPAPCFIVPSWSTDQPSSAPFEGRVLTVHAHTSRSDPCPDDTLDAVLQLVHVVLTDDHASSSVTARRVATPTRLMISDLGTVVRSGAWDIAPVGSGTPAAARRRLLPWPDCSASDLAHAAVAPETMGMN